MNVTSHKKMKNFMVTSALIYAGAITMTMLYAPIANAFGVGIQPSTVEMTIKPGDRHRQVVTIGNVHKSKTISLTMGLADWTLDDNGKLSLSPPGESERSAAEWIRFSPASVTLKPETSMDVIVEISVPYKVKHKGDHRFALLATTLLPALDERGDTSGVWNKYQLASLFYLTLTPSESTPVVSNVAVSNTDKNTVTMTIKNAGDAHARLKGTAFIKDKSGETVAEMPMSAVVLDQGVRNYVMRLDEVEGVTSGNSYTIDFKMNNSFVPQNKFRSTPVDIQSIQYHAP
ncbi:MAG: hypothetical protein L3J65_07125 [Robiginitomaculum sp.]|nr:hypothetical protein [Robiginitomaculum sp.]